MFNRNHDYLSCGTHKNEQLHEYLLEAGNKRYLQCQWYHMSCIFLSKINMIV